MTEIFAAIEIGTSRTVLAVGEAENGGRLKVSVHAAIPSSGVRKSQILDINQAVQSVKGVLHEASTKDTDLNVQSAVLVISGQHIRAEINQGIATIESGRVTGDDIREADANARERQPGNDRELLVRQFAHYFDAAISALKKKPLCLRLFHRIILALY